MDDVVHAYKDIQLVMEAQSELEELVGQFSPRLVKMVSGLVRTKRTGLVVGCTPYSMITPHAIALP